MKKLSGPMIRLLKAVNEGGCYRYRDYPVIGEIEGRARFYPSAATATALLERGLIRLESFFAFGGRVPYGITEAGAEALKKCSE